MDLSRARITKYRPVCDITLPRLEARADRAGVRSSVFRHAARDACGWKGEALRSQAIRTLNLVLRTP